MLVKLKQAIQETLEVIIKELEQVQKESQSTQIFEIKSSSSTNTRTSQTNETSTDWSNKNSGIFSEYNSSKPNTPLSSSYQIQSLRELSSTRHNDDTEFDLLTDESSQKEKKPIKLLRFDAYKILIEDCNTIMMFVAISELIQKEPETIRHDQSLTKTLEKKQTELFEKHNINKATDKKKLYYSNDLVWFKKLDEDLDEQFDEQTLIFDKKSVKFFLELFLEQFVKFKKTVYLLNEQNIEEEFGELDSITSLNSKLTTLGNETYAEIQKLDLLDYIKKECKARLNLFINSFKYYLTVNQACMAAPKKVKSLLAIYKKTKINSHKSLQSKIDIFLQIAHWSAYTEDYDTRYEEENVFKKMINVLGYDIKTLSLCLELNNKYKYQPKIIQEQFLKLIELKNYFFSEDELPYSNVIIESLKLKNLFSDKFKIPTLKGHISLEEKSKNYLTTIHVIISFFDTQYRDDLDSLDNLNVNESRKKIAQIFNKQKNLTSFTKKITLEKFVEQAQKVVSTQDTEFCLENELVKLFLEQWLYVLVDYKNKQTTTNKKYLEINKTNKKLYDSYKNSDLKNEQALRKQTQYYINLIFSNANDSTNKVEVFSTLVDLIGHNISNLGKILQLAKVEKIDDQKLLDKIKEKFLTLIKARDEVYFANECDFIETFSSHFKEATDFSMLDYIPTEEENKLTITERKKYEQELIFLALASFKSVFPEEVANFSNLSLDADDELENILIKEKNTLFVFEQNAPTIIKKLETNYKNNFHIKAEALILFLKQSLYILSKPNYRITHDLLKEYRRITITDEKKFKAKLDLYTQLLHYSRYNEDISYESYIDSLINCDNFLARDLQCIGLFLELLRSRFQDYPIAEKVKETINNIFYDIIEEKEIYSHDEIETINVIIKSANITFDTNSTYVIQNKIETYSIEQQYSNFAHQFYSDLDKFNKSFPRETESLSTLIQNYKVEALRQKITDIVVAYEHSSTVGFLGEETESFLLNLQQWRYILDILDFDQKSLNKFNKEIRFNITCFSLKEFQDFKLDENNFKTILFELIKNQAKIKDKNYTLSNFYIEAFNKYLHLFGWGFENKVTTLSSFLAIANKIDEQTRSKKLYKDLISLIQKLFIKILIFREFNCLIYEKSFVEEICNIETTDSETLKVNKSKITYSKNINKYFRGSFYQALNFFPNEFQKTKSKLLSVKSSAIQDFLKMLTNQITVIEKDSKNDFNLYSLSIFLKQWVDTVTYFINYTGIRVKSPGALKNHLNLEIKDVKNLKDKYFLFLDIFLNIDHDKKFLDKEFIDMFEISLKNLCFDITILNLFLCYAQNVTTTKEKKNFLDRLKPSIHRTFDKIMNIRNNRYFDTEEHEFKNILFFLGIKIEAYQMVLLPADQRYLKINDIYMFLKNFKENFPEETKSLCYSEKTLYGSKNISVLLNDEKLQNYQIAKAKSVGFDIVKQKLSVVKNNLLKTIKNQTFLDTEKASFILNLDYFEYDSKKFLISNKKIYNEIIEYINQQLKNKRKLEKILSDLFEKLGNNFKNLYSFSKITRQLASKNNLKSSSVKLTEIIKENTLAIIQERKGCFFANEVEDMQEVFDFCGINWENPAGTLTLSMVNSNSSYDISLLYKNLNKFEIQEIRYLKDEFASFQKKIANNQKATAHPIQTFQAQVPVILKKFSKIKKLSNEQELLLLYLRSWYNILANMEINDMNNKD